MTFSTVFIGLVSGVVTLLTLMMDRQRFKGLLTVLLIAGAADSANVLAKGHLCHWLFSLVACGCFFYAVHHGSRTYLDFNGAVCCDSGREVSSRSLRSSTEHLSFLLGCGNVVPSIDSV